MELLIQNSIRTKFDQGVSFNTMIPIGTSAKDSDYYLKAHELELKLQYQLNQSAAQTFTRKSSLECDNCAG
jgi:hypothetical protein